MAPECQPTLYGAEASRTGQNGGGSGAPNPLVGAEEKENGHDFECAAEVKMAPSVGKHPARTRRRGSGANREWRRSTKTVRTR